MELLYSTLQLRSRFSISQIEQKVHAEKILFSLKLGRRWSNKRSMTETLPLVFTRQVHHWSLLFKFFLFSLYIFR